MWTNSLANILFFLESYLSNYNFFFFFFFFYPFLSLIFFFKKKGFKCWPWWICWWCHRLQICRGTPESSQIISWIFHPIGNFKILRNSKIVRNVEIRRHAILGPWISLPSEPRSALPHNCSVRDLLSTSPWSSRNAYDTPHHPPWYIFSILVPPPPPLFF